MPELENVTALEPVYAEWGEGSFGRWFEVFAPDYEWGFAGDFPEGAVAPDPAQTSGKSERLRAWLSPWEKWRCPAERYIPIGDQVLVLTRYVGTAKGAASRSIRRVRTCGRCAVARRCASRSFPTAARRCARRAASVHPRE